MIDTETLAQFVRQFKVPEAGLPYLDAFVNEQEVRLVLAAADGGLTLAAAQAALGVTVGEAGAALDGAYRRGVFNRDERDGQAVYTPTSFYRRMDYFATFDDAWFALPEEARRALDEWMLGEYIEEVRPNVERLQTGLPPLESPGNDSILLVDELDAIIDHAQTIAVFPCNCRRIAGRCRRPVETCVQFDHAAEMKLARGLGRRLTPAEAKALVRWADKKGLMHTTDLEGRDGGPAPICNCCADDCYVFRAAARLDSKGAWPRSRYVARLDADACNHCGACTRRCHFGAFFLTGDTVERNGRQRQRVALDPALCWGCGLCANACPPGAITMAPLT